MRRFLLTGFFLAVCAAFAGAQTVRWTIKPMYSSIEPMDEYIMKVKVSGKTGAITRDGRVLIEPVVDSLTAFVEGKALALNKFQDEYFLMGILGQDQSVRRPDDTYYIREYPFFSEGLLPAYDSRGMYGYLDETGKPAIPFKFMNVHPFCEGYAAVSKGRPEIVGRLTDGIKAFGMNSVFYIDKNGEELKLEKDLGTIDMGTSFYEGKAVVQQRKGGAYYTISRDGTILEMTVRPLMRLDWKYRLTEEEFPRYVPVEVEDGPVVFYMGGQSGYREGNDIFLPAQFAYARSFSGGYALASLIYGFYGLLKLVPDGRIFCWQQKGPVNPGAGMESVTFQLSLPDVFRNDDWKVTCQAEGQPANETILFKDNSSQREASFTLLRLPRTVEVSVDGIILYKGGFPILDQEEPKPESEPELELDISVVATSRRANSNDNFSFDVVITNPGKRSVEVPVSVTGTNVVFKDQTVTVPAGEKARLSGYFTRVTRTQTRSITVTCGDKTVSKSLTVRPIVGN